MGKNTANSGKKSLGGIYILLLFVTLFNVSNTIKDISFVILLALFTAVYLRNNKHADSARAAQIKILKAVTGLMLLMLIVSLITVSWGGFSNLIPSNFVTVGMILISVYVAFLCNECFGKRNIRYICMAVVANYIVTLVVFCVSNLFEVSAGQLEFLGMRPITTLEVHELAFVAGAIFVYLVTNKEYKRMPVLTLAVLGIVLVDFKRINFVAFAIIGVLMLCRKLIVKDVNKMARIVRCVTYVIVFVYLMLMTVFLDQTLGIISSFGINMSWRDHFYRMIYATRSHLSPVLGTGIRSTDYMMSTDSIWNFVGAIHNDILRLFLENGIVLLALYVYTFVSYIPKTIKKVCDDYAQLVCGFLILFTFVCYMTDNLFTYYRFVFVLFSLIFTVISSRQIVNKTHMGVSRELGKSGNEDNKG